MLNYLRRCEFLWQACRRRHRHPFAFWPTSRWKGFRNAWPAPWRCSCQRFASEDRTCCQPAPLAPETTVIANATLRTSQTSWWTDLFGVLDALDLFAVRGYVIEGFGIVDGKNEEEAFARPHVLISHGRVLLLAGSVQDVQEACLAIYDHLLAVRVLDRGVILVHEVILDQLNGQGTFSDASGWKQGQRGRDARTT